jgi:hypothetical protein
MSQATMINDSLKDPAQTSILAVTRPEELPINETIELATTVPETFPDQRLLRVLINRVLPKHFTASELERLQQAAPANRQIKAALAQAEHRAAQQRQIGRVRRALDSETALRSLPEVGRLADDELLALAKAAMR